MARWRLLAGIHSDRHTQLVSYGSESQNMVRDNPESRIAADDPLWSDPEAPKTYYVGDVFDCDKDLSRHNQRGRAKRFEELGDAPPVAKSPPPKKKPAPA
jgi:hypothetical protein